MRRRGSNSTNLIPNARPPQRADRSAAGSLPTRAFRYCEPVVTASSFGYYVFPPIDFTVIWDGDAIVWTYDGAGEWLPLNHAQFPHFASHFDEHVPEEIRGFSPPFLSALQEPGLLQIWTGLVARTPPGWSLLVRGCANLPRAAHYEPFEGVIETDRWFGPLISNVRLTKTDTPIEFRTEFPVFQVQALPREALDDAGQNRFRHRARSRCPAARGLGRFLRHRGAAECLDQPATRRICGDRPAAAAGRGEGLAAVWLSPRRSQGCVTRRRPLDQVDRHF